MATNGVKSALTGELPKKNDDNISDDNNDPQRREIHGRDAELVHM